MTLPIRTRLLRPLDRSPEPRLRALVDGKAKPPGSLGRIEGLAVELALIRGTESPSADKATLLVFAGDHGMNEEGVSAYPSAVTAAMVATFLAGRATANAFARSIGAMLRVHDVGVATAMPTHPDLVSRRVRAGTRNAAREAAMTAPEADAALAAGAEAADRAIDDGADLILLGEMGIGNSASAALLMHRLLPAPLDACIGAGAGHDPAGMDRKRAILAQAAARSAATDPFAVLREFGGLEIAAMAGAALAAAHRDRPVVVDGFIAGAAALVAVRLQPAARERMIFAHRSAEQGHAALLGGLDARPLLDLGMRLGEGTGALLAVPLLRAAAALLTEVASLAEVLGDA